MNMTETDRTIAYLKGRPWIQTASGRAFPLAEPQPVDVYWPDVVYALSHLTRFAGHTGGYTVGQHTIHPWNELPAAVRPYWLLHDAHEFAIGDITRPAVKAIEFEASQARASNGFVIASALRGLKNGLDYAIYTAAGLEWPLPADVLDAIHEADNRMLATESRDLLGSQVVPWDIGDVQPYDCSIVDEWTPYTVYTFLSNLFRMWLKLDVPPLYEMLEIVRQQRATR